MILRVFISTVFTTCWTCVFTTPQLVQRFEAGFCLETLKIVSSCSKLVARFRVDAGSSSLFQLSAPCGTGTSTICSAIRSQSTLLWDAANSFCDHFYGSSLDGYTRQRQSLDHLIHFFVRKLLTAPLVQHGRRLHVGLLVTLASAMRRGLMALSSFRCIVWDGADEQVRAGSLVQAAPRTFKLRHHVRT